MVLSDRFAGKTVLVTGGSGFIGTHVCRRLTECGGNVHAVSRKYRPQLNEQIRWWQAELSDIAAVRRVLRAVQPQVVFHLASRVVGARELNAVLPTFYDNLVSTVHLLTVAAELGCERIVLASSSEEPDRVDNATFARSPYAAAKYASNIYGRTFYRLFELPVVMPRIFMTYGPDQKDQQKLVPFVVRHLLRDESPRLTSGHRKADWIYVDDVVEGLLKAAVTPGIEGSTFDLGTGSLVSVREIVERIAQIVGSSAELVFGTIPDRPYEQERAADTHFMSDKVGFQPAVSLKEGLASTIAWYRQQLNRYQDHPHPQVSDEGSVRPQAKL